MEKLLQTQQTESTSRRLELERNLARCQSDLRTRTQQLEQLTAQLSQSQKVYIYSWQARLARVAGYVQECSLPLRQQTNCKSK